MPYRSQSVRKYKTKKSNIKDMGIMKNIITFRSDLNAASNVSTFDSNGFYTGCLNPMASLLINASFTNFYRIQFDRFRIKRVIIDWWIDGIFNGQGITTATATVSGNYANGVYDLTEAGKPFTIITYWDKTNDTSTINNPTIPLIDEWFLKPEAKIQLFAPRVDQPKLFHTSISTFPNAGWLQTNTTLNPTQLALAFNPIFFIGLQKSDAMSTSYFSIAKNFYMHYDCKWEVEFDGPKLQVIANPALFGGTRR